MTLYFNGTGRDTDWNNTDNWFTSPGQTNSYGSTPSIDDELYFETSCDTNIPTQLDYYITVLNGATLTLNTTDLIQGGVYYMQVNAGGILSAAVSAYLNGSVTVDGTINVLATLNTGAFTMGSSAICNISGLGIALFTAGSINQSAVINVTNNGSLYLYNYFIQSTINVTNSLVSYANTSIAVAPVIAGTSTITIANGSIVSTNITIPSNSSFTINNSSVASSYTITNNGTAILQIFSGNGSFVNNNSCTISNVVTVATVTNNSTLTVTTGTLNSPTFTNNGTTTVNSGGIISFTPATVFTNNGTFNLGSLYSTKFSGRIFPQVPSSASWGNALL